jgi:hypothetical protein
MKDVSSGFAKYEVSRQYKCTIYEGMSRLSLNSNSSNSGDNPDIGYESHIRKPRTRRMAMKSRCIICMRA